MYPPLNHSACPTGVTITRTKSEGCDSKLGFHVNPFKSYHPRFNSDVTPVIKYEDLVLHPVDHLAANIQVVTFENQLFVYKFMNKDSEQCEFEREVERYQMLKDCDGVPVLGEWLYDMDCYKGS